MQTVLVPLTQERSVTVYSVDDVEPVLEHNKLLRTMEQKSDWGRHYASVPNILVVKWLNEEWQRGNDIRYLSREWDELFEKKLRDPEYAYLRTDCQQSHLGWR